MSKVEDKNTPSESVTDLSSEVRLVSEMAQLANESIQEVLRSDVVEEQLAELGRIAASDDPLSQLEEQLDQKLDALDHLIERLEAGNEAVQDRLDGRRARTQEQQDSIHSHEQRQRADQEPAQDPRLRPDRGCIIRRKEEELEAREREPHSARDQEAKDQEHSNDSRVREPEPTRIVSNPTKVHKPNVARIEPVESPQQAPSAQPDNSIDQMPAPEPTHKPFTEHGAHEFKRVFEENFEYLDDDKDGFVSEQEIYRAMEDPNVTGESAQLVAALSLYRTQLEELSDDEWFDENSGVTIADVSELVEIVEQSRTDSEFQLSDNQKELLERVEHAMQTPELAEGHFASDLRSRGFTKEDAEEFQQILNENFNYLDKDYDGYLSKSEIDRAVQDHNVKGELAQAVTALKWYREELQVLNDDEWFWERSGVSKEDVARFAELVEKYPPESKDLKNPESKLVRGVDGVMYYTRAINERTEHQLYANERNPLTISVNFSKDLRGLSLYPPFSLLTTALSGFPPQCTS